MMRPNQRPRTGSRRDGLVRTINSAEVRYPGVELPETDQREYDLWRESGRILMPARDTGLALEGRTSRERRRRERKKRQQIIAMTCALVALTAAAIVWRTSSDARAARTPEVAVATPAARRSNATDPNVAQMRALHPEEPPTPIIARYKNLEMRLPVRLRTLTELGFHQASYSYAVHLKTEMPFADMSAVKKAKTTHRDISKQATGPSAVLTGAALVMWRDRPGKPDTAVDVGAKPGSDVLAPVDGTVVKVKKYKLYGKYTDYEIHIQPNGLKTIDVVMIHITDVSVTPGTPVRAGVTRIGAVRKLSDRETLQLGHYTKGGGDHTHVQLNDATDPEYKGLEGAISVSGS